MAIADDFIRELKQRINVVDIASEKMKLVKSGRNYKACCPFHGEKTPSFTVYPGSNTYHCFGCGESGDVITFAMKTENLPYVDAVKMLAERVGLQVPEQGKGLSDQERNLRVRILEMNRETARFYYQNLVSANGEKAKQYLVSRQMPEAAVRHFGLGYAGENFFGLVNYLKGLGYSQDEIVQGNLGVVSKNGHLIDRYRDRLMLPIFDTRGNVIGFGGRTLGDDKAKYINTQTTPVFKKSDELFALNFAKNTKSDRMILVEGYMDVIALHGAGFANSVASLGTALTESHGKILARYAKEVVICYDSDNAGQAAALKAINILRSNKLQIRVAQIPGAKDPDEFLKLHPKDGAALLGQLFDTAPNDIEYRMARRRELYDLENPGEKVKYLNDAAGILKSLDNALEQDVYASVLSAELDVSKDSIMHVIRQLPKERVNSFEKTEAKKAESVPVLTEEPLQRFHAWIRPYPNEESEIVAFADVVINEDFRINGIRLVLENENDLSVMMPAYKAQDQSWVPLVEMDKGLEMELVNFLTDNLDFENAVEVIGGGTAIACGKANLELHPVTNKGAVKAYARISNDVLVFKATKVLEGKTGVFLAPPDVGRKTDDSGKKHYFYAYEFASATLKTQLAESAKTQLYEKNKHVKREKIAVKEV